jgi:DNA adenine methylase
MLASSQPSQARPFLKWAGGKGQLLAQFESFFPDDLKEGAIRRYVEPFIGSGAVFFKVAHSFPSLELVISDINPELILAYRTLQGQVDGLIETLQGLQARYLRLSEDARKDFYYQLRADYNAHRSQIDYEVYQAAWIERTAQLIFLNRTGYNGLFRLNSQGAFNVPFGRYKNPRLLDSANLRAVARLLQNVHIQFGDFESIARFVDQDTLVYFDPPYRPISSTAHFTAYSREAFDDTQQLRLATFYRTLDARGAKLMLSNSDPHNLDPGDDFFERAYAGYRIERVQASRNINRLASRRGPIAELLILNYPRSARHVAPKNKQV